MEFAKSPWLSPCAWTQTDLIGDDSVWSGGEAGAVLVELIAQSLQLFPRLCLGHVEHIEQAHAPFHVAQEGKAQPPVLVRAGDQPRDVGHWWAERGGQHQEGICCKAKISNMWYAYATNNGKACKHLSVLPYVCMRTRM